MAKNKKLNDAAYAVWLISGFLASSRLNLLACIDNEWISPDDPWVAACLNCVEDSDIPDIALEFFIADIKSGFYDLAW